MKILITAPPKTGKSTLLKKLLSSLSSDEVSGILTEEIVENNQRKGFQANVIGADLGYVIAHTDSISSQLHIGKYSIDKGAISKSFQKALLRKKSIFFIDEIRRMQSSSSFFLDQAYDLLANNQDVCVVATIVYDDEIFAQRFKKLHNVKIIEVTHENRDILPKKLLELIKS